MCKGNAKYMKGWIAAQAAYSMCKSVLLPATRLSCIVSLCALHTGSKSAPSRTSLKEAVRVATIDNFQGEESQIVILSLVRSNS